MLLLVVVVVVDGLQSSTWPCNPFVMPMMTRMIVSQLVLPTASDLSKSCVKRSEIERGERKAAKVRTNQLGKQTYPSLCPEMQVHNTQKTVMQSFDGLDTGSHLRLSKLASILILLAKLLQIVINLGSRELEGK